MPDEFHDDSIYPSVKRANERQLARHIVVHGDGAQITETETADSIDSNRETKPQNNANDQQ